MVAYFENSDFFFNLQQIFTDHQITTQGWQNYDLLTERLRCCQPQVVLLGLNLHENPIIGLNALMTIKEKFPRIKVIVLTCCPTYVLRAFRLGADGCLMKKEIAHSIQYIQEVINDVTHGEIYMSCDVRKAIVASLTPYERISLNTRERQIVHLAAHDKSGPQIAEMLHLKSQTIETYFKNIKLKMDCHTIQGVVAKAMRNNMIQWEEAIS